MSSLFIAGNGFDIAHGIPTQYSRFRSFIIQKYPEALELRDQVVYLEDFESNHDYWYAIEAIANDDIICLPVTYCSTAGINIIDNLNALADLIMAHFAQ